MQTYTLISVCLFEQKANNYQKYADSNNSDLKKIYIFKSKYR